MAVPKPLTVKQADEFVATYGIEAAREESRKADDAIHPDRTPRRHPKDVDTLWEAADRAEAANAKAARKK